MSHDVPLYSPFQVIFAWMATLSIFGHGPIICPSSIGLYEKKMKNVSQNQLFANLFIDQIATVLFQVIPTSRTSCLKISRFTSLDNFQKDNVSREYSIAHHDDKMCFPPISSSFQMTKTAQSFESVYANTIEQIKKTKFEREPTETVDCFLDSYDK